jgi:hypothetical protein
LSQVYATPRRDGERGARNTTVTCLEHELVSQQRRAVEVFVGGDH